MEVVVDGVRETYQELVETELTLLAPERPAGCSQQGVLEVRG